MHPNSLALISARFFTGFVDGERAKIEQSLLFWSSWCMADVLTHDSCKNVSCYAFMYSLLIDESHALATDCAAGGIPRFARAWTDCFCSFAMHSTSCMVRQTSSAAALTGLLPRASAVSAHQVQGDSSARMTLLSHTLSRCVIQSAPVVCGNAHNVFLAPAACWRDAHSV